MDRIRPFKEEDIPQVAELHVRVFPEASRLPAKSREPYFKEVFIDNPWYEEALPPLVYERDGKVFGFVGVLPRRMLMNGQPIRVAVSSQFMVERGNRSAVVGAALLKRFFSGAQDLSMTDGGNTPLRSLWEALGGRTSILHSLHWIRVLRPAQFGLSFLRRYKLLSPLALLWPLGVLTDIIATHAPGSPFRPRPQGPEGDLTISELLEWISQTSRHRTLRPEYDEHSLQWLLENTTKKMSTSPLRRVSVYTEKGGKIGWYLYSVKPRGVGQVVQIGAKPNSIGTVLDHLFYHAWRRGGVAVSGRVEPEFADALWERKCLFGFFGSWFLIHSRRPEILDAIHRADALLTRLEGEWWMPFFQ